MSSVARLIDANANRAREGLRMVEDVARFVLNDGAACAELKAIRHGLGEAIGSLPVDRGMLLAWRDTAGDVGTGATTAGEASRADLPEIVAAAAGRLAEALRAIEEGAKALKSGGVASEVERLRYRAYDACGGVERALGTGRTEQWRLCVLITEALCAHHPWERVAELAVEGGADCLQLREKGLETGELIARARKLMEIARGAADAESGTGGKPVPRIIVNDRVDVALAAGADGVHVGQGDMSVREVRQIAGNSLLVGVSTGNVEQARAAAAAGADYCGVGPMFASSTKPKAVAGLGYLREYLADAACARVPHLAIGGIGAANLGELVGAGCRGIAVSSAVCAAEEPGAVCGELRTLLAS